MNERILVTISDAAEMIGVSRTTMYSLINTRIVPTVMLGKIRRVSVDALKGLVNDRQEPKCAESEQETTQSTAYSQ